MGSRGEGGGGGSAIWVEMIDKMGGSLDVWSWKAYHRGGRELKVNS